jgi:hypothetical protein
VEELPPLAPQAASSREREESQETALICINKADKNRPDGPGGGQSSWAGRSAAQLAGHLIAKRGRKMVGVGD